MKMNSQPAAVAGGQFNPQAFDAATSLNMVNLETKAYVSGGTTTWNIPRVGYLAWIDIPISSAVTGGTLGAVSAHGFSAVVKRVHVKVNNIGDIVDISGPGYSYLLMNYINNYINPTPANNGVTAITAAAFDLSMRIPISFNDRDYLGAILLQNEQTLATLSIDWEALTTVTATGAITAFNVTPTVYFWTVPEDPAARPPVRYIHQILEDQVTVSGSGAVNYDVPRGGILTHLLFGAGLLASSADAWSEAILRLQSSYSKYDFSVATADIAYGATHQMVTGLTPARNRVLGVLPFDFVGTSGLGCYGKMRDVIDTRNITSMRVVITATGAISPLYAMRRQIAELARQ
jgi:hypothetical protein